MPSIFEIEKESYSMLEQNNSKFLAYTFAVKTESDANSALGRLKTMYQDATHICFAYVLTGIENFCDDGEPQGTAGKPILNILKKNNIQNTLIAVVRYFGGIKLGAGGLIRAYSNVSKTALINSGKKELTDCEKFKFVLHNDENKFLKKVQAIFGIKNYEISYSPEIVMTIIADNMQTQTVKSQIQ